MDLQRWAGGNDHDETTEKKQRPTQTKEDEDASYKSAELHGGEQSRAGWQRDTGENQGVTEKRRENSHRK